MSILVSTFGCFMTLLVLVVATGAGVLPLLALLPGPCLGTRNDPLMDPLRPRVDPRKELALFPWKLPRNEP